MTQASNRNQHPVALWLTMMGIGLILYSIPTFIPGLVGSLLSLLLPPIVATIVWYYWYPQTNLEDMGLVAGLLSGVGAMVGRLVLPPSVEWFASLLDIAPEQFELVLATILIPFAYAIIGYLTSRVLARVRKTPSATTPPTGQSSE